MSLRRSFSLLLLASAIMAGCASDPPDVPTGADGAVDPELTLGREVFAARCVSCHGESGGGGRGPNITGDRMAERYPDPADQIAVVTAGRNEMPAFEDVLSPEQIAAVVRYTREVL
ncbi:MAG: cytochrome c [Acidimicrobiales bacterium]|nr:cytochrome c [Acidimicrobiales bacterium]